MNARPVALFALALLAVPLAALAADPDHGEHEHRMARILERRVHPAVLEVHASDAIGWLNYSSQRARISFDADVARHLTCTSRGTFHLNGDRLVTRDIQATQFASLCNLAPGEYEYRVELGAGFGGSGVTPTGRAFEGRIVVSE